MKKYIITFISFFGFIATTLAQLNPLSGIYYQNQYLANPALVGIDLNWELGGHLKAQWTAIEGAPIMQALTLTYGAPNKKVGTGLYLYNESAGAIKRTSAKLSYAYHLILNTEKTNFLDFGISGGIMDEWIDFSKVKGDLTDISLNNFNQREMYFDGDFGTALRTERLNIQTTLPNLRRLFYKNVKRSVVDRSIYMAAISYKISGGMGTTTLEPKLTYRGVENYKDILDASLNIGFSEGKLNVMGTYHSTNSVTFGIGTIYQKRLNIMCLYTSNTADLQGYSNSEFEIGVKYRWR